jgi:excinuclease ABC subunit A
MLVCITRVSGSGKSTLVQETLYRPVARAFRAETLPMDRFSTLTETEHLLGVRLIDQQPIGRSPRSSPITYLNALNETRRLFALQPKARRQSLSLAHFSFNQPEGRCKRCQDAGYERLEMHFLEDMYVTCEECHGRRYGPAVLSIRVRGKTIQDVLSMTIDEALLFWEGQGSTRLGGTLRLLASIGLGYLRLGRAATTLSGGEAQRLKIVAELRASTPRGLLYILDEPTRGLHIEDTKKLLGVLGRLVDGGNTMLVVEHHLDVIKTGGWVIGLGPEGETREVGS